MQSINPYYIFIFIGISLAIIEIILGAATAFELLILGILFVIAGFTGMISGSTTVSIATVVILGLLYIFFGRQFVRNRFNIETKSTNIDNVIGKKGLVVKKITPSKTGQVKVEGEIWRAKADASKEEDTEVTIVSVSGITLHVK